MDLFGGNGEVAKACERLGYRAKVWDPALGPHHDLTDPGVVKRLVREVKRGRVLAIMMAPGAASFSRAKDREHPTRTLRFPWGLPRRFLSPTEHEAVRAGNLVFRTCLKIIHLAQKFRIPWVLEHPLSSKCWALPPLRTLLHTPGVALLQSDLCQFGAPWKQPTCFLTSSTLDHHHLSLSCSGGGGLCSRMRRKHWRLPGTDVAGLARVPEKHPKRLARALAHVLTSPYHTCSEFAPSCDVSG